MSVTWLPASQSVSAPLSKPSSTTPPHSARALRNGEAKHAGKLALLPARGLVSKLP